MPDDGQIWTEVRADEEARATRRRERLVTKLKCTCRFPANRVGLALSGGGIRSATFSLGLMRSLSEQRLIHAVDYLSTVSGGGYAGAFFCSLFIKNEWRGPAPVHQESVDSEHPDPSGGAGAAGVAPGTQCDVLGLPDGLQGIAQLRQGGHYLAPNGTSDALFAAVIAARNWFALAIVCGLAIMAAFFLVNLAVMVLDPLIIRSGALAHFRIRDDRYGVWQFILIILAFWPACCAWAYWFTRSGRVPLSRFARLFSMQSLVAAMIFALAFVFPSQPDDWHEVIWDSVLVMAGLSFATYILAELVSFRRDRRAGAVKGPRSLVEALAEEDRVRNRLSRWLLRGTLVFLGTAALATMHWASREQIFKGGRILRDVSFETDILVTAAVVTLLLVVGTRPVIAVLDAKAAAGLRKRRVPARIRQLLSLAAGGTLLAAFIAFWAAVAGGASHWIERNTFDAWKAIADRAPAAFDLAQAWVLKPLDIPIDSSESAAVLLLLVTIKVGVIAYLLGNVDSLLNRSSMATFYSGRLRSAYLGATNRRRQRHSEKSGTGASHHSAPVPLDHDDPNDEITLRVYYSPAVLAPIHLINVTINETTSSSSRVIQRDRKGKSMTVAPSGYLFPPRSPAEPLALISRDQAEDLPLSSWMSISGAAFTTGAGHHTSLGTSMLATVANVRLGYWWNKSCQTERWGLRRPSRLVQTYLLRELRASYEGTSGDRWYLSDGGHYENTGVYELVRRRVPFIIASDNGADPLYEFGDLVNLMRKARIDFGTEIEFLDEEELNDLFPEAGLRDVFGSLNAIRLSGRQESRSRTDVESDAAKAGPYATLARIRYPKRDGEAAMTGTLLLIKPRITGRELPDLVQYSDANSPFPQQPTTNQFFDEAQWESYFRLGQLIGDTIFKKDRFSQKDAPSRWVPWNLEPLPSSLPARSTRGARGRKPASGGSETRAKRLPLRDDA
ncbi:MAG TPA: hypothetical protein VF702_11305 [Allosphingosinicella sp.]|jgi:hypothetical protein